MALTKCGALSVECRVRSVECRARNDDGGL